MATRSESTRGRQYLRKDARHRQKGIAPGEKEQERGRREGKSSREDWVERG